MTYLNNYGYVESKWDTIQADVWDMYVAWDEEIAYEESVLDPEDFDVEDIDLDEEMELI